MTVVQQAREFLALRVVPLHRRLEQRFLDAVCRPFGIRYDRSWKRQGCDVFVYFGNDQKSAAPADALKLSRLLA